MYTMQAHPYDRSTWQKPKTTRRYLHPPKSERLFTLWAEGKIIFGEEYDGTDVPGMVEGDEFYKDLESCGIWLLHGPNRDGFDFKTVENITSADGTPIHGIRHRLENVEVTEECFCDTQRKSTCFIKVSIKNTTDVAVHTQISFLLRTGKEAQLACGAPNNYRNYAPDVAVWKNTQPATWQKKAGVFTDGKRVLTPIAGVCPAWDAAAGALDFILSLAPGETQEVIFALNHGETILLDYAAQKAATQQFWRETLGRMNKLPTVLADDPKTLQMLRHMVTQLLQCLTYPVGKSYLLWRQGGFQRIVWPGEVHVCFDALAQLGDFSDYLEPVLDTYFHVMQAPDGEIVNIGIYWICVTGCVLYSFGKYCLHAGDAGRKCYDTYRDQAFAAFEWMRNTRKTTIGIPELAQGLFPPKRATDWAQVFQHWGLTDNYNLLGLQAFMETAEAFSDPRADEIRMEYTEYLSVMREYVKPYIEKAKDTEELYIPLKPIGDDRKLVEDLHPILKSATFIRSGAVEKEEYIRKIYQWVKRTGRCDGGLYGRMQQTKDENPVWYVSTPDFDWFHAWGIVGEREKQKEILRDQLQYGMTEEFMMLERYDETRPYSCPWSPNASANGRTILMLLTLAR